jgi:glutamyl-tRNA reductase
MLGASHHDVDLDLLSQLSLAEDGLAVRLISSHPHVRGAVVLSTCNRFEVYLDLDRFHSAVDFTMDSIAESSGVEPRLVVDRMSVLLGTQAAQHLFSVASGLESMVVGEDEIAGQVRRALATARQQGTTNPTLERLLQHALSASKAVSHSTGLGVAGRSIVGVGLDLLEQRHGRLHGRRTLVLGTGAYARVVVASLQRRGCTTIDVYSASGQATLFAASHPVRPVPDAALVDALAAADLVVATSGGTPHLLDATLISAARPAPSPTLPIMDLALSSDVHPDVRALSSADVIDLELIGRHAPEEHATAVLHAQDIVLRAVEEFEEHERGRTADHAVVAMRAHVMTIINEELERIRGRVDPETAEEVARSLRRVSNAILHQPSVRARELARTGDFGEYRRAIHTLFGIDVGSIASD